MFKHVIVGVDGRQGGRDAIALARMLAGGEGRMTLTHVYEMTPVGVAGEAYLDIRREDAAELLERERTEAGVEAALVTVAAFSIGRGLHTLLEEEDADLLVVGSRHRGVVGRVLMGDDTRTALNGAPCAVAVAPMGYAQRLDDLREIGVGWDGSPESDAALALARELAAARGAGIRVMHVVQLPATTAVALAVSWGEALDEMLKEAKADVEALDGVVGEAALGIVGEELAEFGGRVDLLVVGSRGYGPVRRLVLGSTSVYLTRHARCPVLVLPRKAHRTDGAQAERVGEHGAPSS